jgi:hypothetical protein
MTTQRAGEGKTTKHVAKPGGKTPTQRQQAGTQRVDPGGMAGLQQNFGNRAVQRLLAQRSGPEEQENRQVSSTIQTDIEQKRGHGESLDEHTQQQMSGALGYDFSEVQVHTDADSHQLNESLQARAFTTGQDVFFRQGQYNPNSSEGQELLAHELTHVVQQQEGQVDLGGEGMRVNDPDDAYEKEADRMAEQVTGPTTESAVAHTDAGGIGRNQGGIQRADALEDEILEKPLQRQDMDEEELMAKPIQREDVQRAEIEEDILEKPLQRQDMDEEDLMAKPIQREDDVEEDILEKPLQRQDVDEEELMAKPIQREDDVEEDILQKPVQRQAINRKTDCLCS